MATTALKRMQHMHSDSLDLEVSSTQPCVVTELPRGGPEPAGCMLPKNETLQTASKVITGTRRKGAQGSDAESGSDRKSRQRIAQARYRMKQRGKKAEAEVAVRMLSSAMQELRDLRSAFASERTAFRADQAAFCVRAQMAGCIPSSLQPDASTLSIVATDTFEVLACKVPGIRKQYLDSLFTLLCNTHAACNWPLPSRPEFEKAVLNNVLDRLAMYQTAITSLLRDVDASPTEATLSKLKTFMHSMTDVCIRMWDRYADGQPIAYILDEAWTAGIIQRYGHPAPDHWQRVLAAMGLSTRQLEQMRDWRTLFMRQVSAAQQAQLASSCAFAQPVGFQHTHGLPSALEAEKEVQKCIRAQRCAAVALARAIKVDILLPYQYAQMEATSFPYRVDFVALVDEASRALDSQTQALPSIDASWQSSCHAAPAELMAAPGLASPPASTALLGGLEVPSTLADALAFESAQSLQQLPAAPLRGISTPALQQALASNEAISTPGSWPGLDDPGFDALDLLRLDMPLL